VTYTIKREAETMNLELKAEIIRRFGSQVNFAMAIKEDESFVSRIINGRRTLKAEDKEKWARALGTKPEKLFKD